MNKIVISDEIKELIRSSNKSLNSNSTFTEKRERFHILNKLREELDNKACNFNETSFEQLEASLIDYNYKGFGHDYCYSMAKLKVSTEILVLKGNYIKSHNEEDIDDKILSIYDEIRDLYR